MPDIILSVEPIRYPLTGIGRYTLELARHLERLPDPGGRLRYYAHGRFLDNLPQPQVEAHRAAEPRVPMNSRARRLAARFPAAIRAYGLWDELRRSRPLRRHRDALFHGPNFYLPRFPGRSVVTIHDLSVYTVPQFHPAERVLHLRSGIETALGRADMILTDSDFVRGEMLERFSVSPDRIRTIPLASQTAFVPRDADAVAPVLKTYGLAHRGYCLYAGTIEPRKNVSMLIRAYAALQPALRARFPLVIIGHSGWQSEEIHRLIQTGVEQGWLIYPGFVPDADLAVVYAGARCFAFPTLYEGFGLPVLEAMASGTPVIASNASCIPEVAGDAAALVDPNDVEGWSAALERGLQDEDWRSGAISKGLKRAAGYSWHRTATQTAEAYRDVLAG